MEELHKLWPQIRNSTVTTAWNAPPFVQVGVQETHLETAVWRTRSPAPPVWVWTGWGLGSEHLAEPEKAMRRSDESRKALSAAAAQQYSTVINISNAVISSNSLNYESEFLLPSKEEQMLIWHWKTKPAAPKPSRLVMAMETPSGKRAVCSRCGSDI